VTAHLASNFSSSLSYERPEENLFFIRIETNDGEQIEIRLASVE